MTSFRKMLGMYPQKRLCATWTICWKGQNPRSIAALLWESCLGNSEKNETYSRALGVNRRLAALCNTNKYSFRFVDPWTAFYGSDVLFQRDGVHLSARGARNLAKLLNFRLFKPVKEIRGVQADKPDPVDRLNTKKPRRNRNKKRRKQQSEKTTTRPDAPVPPPVAGGSSGVSGSPNPPTGPGKRQRSQQTGGTPSPTQGPSQRRRCVSLDGGQRKERPHHSLS